MSPGGFSLRSLLFPVAAVPSTIVFSLMSVAGGLLRTPPGFQDWVHRWWSRSLLVAAGVEVRISGEENLEPGGAQVLACNHQSMFDILALLAAVPGSVRFVAKSELAQVPLFAGAMRGGGHVFIDRTNPRHAITQMRRLGERMRREGLSVVVFPEGTRSRDGRLRRFKRAPFLLAIETDAPVLPVALEGGAGVMRKGSLWTRPGRMSVRIGTALTTDGLDPSDRGPLARSAHDSVADLLEEVREGS